MIIVLVVAIVALLLMVAWRHQPLALTSTRATTNVMTPELEAFRHVSPRHMDLVDTHSREFHRVFQATFDPSAGDEPAAAVRGLFARRASVLQALHEIRLRLPNDLDLERALAAAIEDCDRWMLEHIEDARERTGAVLLHPGPVDDAWYGRWYRASNDEME